MSLCFRCCNECGRCKPEVQTVQTINVLDNLDTNCQSYIKTGSIQEFSKEKIAQKKIISHNFCTDQIIHPPIDEGMGVTWTGNGCNVDMN